MATLSELLKERDYFYNLGKIHYQQGDYHKAQKCWVRQANINQFCKKKLFPEDNDLHFNSWPWSRAIGHICVLGNVIKAKLRNHIAGEKIKFYIDEDYISNFYLLQKFSPYLEFIPKKNWIEKKQDMFIKNHSLKRFDTSFGNIYINNMIFLGHYSWIKDKQPPIISLTEKETETGYKTLQTIGLNPNKWFVTLHCRGGNFKNDDDCFRNIKKIENYHGAIKTIIDAGGQIIFLGESLQQSGQYYPDWFTKNVINYCDSDIKSKELDNFLCAENKFLLGCVSGIANIPQLFAKPVLQVNICPLASRNTYINDMLLPKKIKNISANKYLNFDEIMKSPFSCVEFAQHFNNDNFLIEENTNIEIQHATEDMLLYLDNNLKYKKTVESILNKIDPTNEKSFDYQSIFAPSFVKNNPDICLL